VVSLEGHEDRSASILLVTVWELGEACGPLLIAPLSEVYGRYPSFNVANILFILGVVLAAVSQTAGLFIFARFLTGFAVASNVLAPAIIGDIFPSHSRGSGMSLVMLAPLVGGAVGPAISGVVAESFSWRWCLWISAAIAIICEALFFVFFRETYKVVILQRKAARLRKERGDESLKCAWEADEAATALYWHTLRGSIKRPLLMMWDSSVLKIISFYGAISFTLFYILATTLPDILTKIYGFSPSLTGYSFMTFSKHQNPKLRSILILIGVGSTGGIVVCNLFLDRLYIRLGKSRGGTAQPEYRLPFLIIGAVIMPLTVATYGWTPYAHWPVWVLLLSVAILGCFLLMISVSLASYVVDAFGIYSASAMTIVLIARCVGGTLLPLAIPPLTDALGFGYGFLVQAGILVALIPLPIGVLCFGRRWRQNSEYTRDD
jgi:MFS family permease